MESKIREKWQLLQLGPLVEVVLAASMETGSMGLGFRFAEFEQLRGLRYDVSERKDVSR